MYAIVYNEAEKQFEVVEGTTSNISGEDIWVETELLIVEDFAASYNNWLLKGTAEVQKCVQCKKFFILGRTERNWFDHKGLFHPKRCRLCRGRNRKPRDKNTSYSEDTTS